MLLVGTIPEDQMILDILEHYREELSEYQDVIGVSNVFLRRNSSKESNIGNMVSDASRTCYWNDTTIAFQNNGGIRSDLPAGNIIGEDLFNIWPFSNTVDKVVLKGKKIREWLEESAAPLCPNKTCYAKDFVQVSGLKVLLDLNRK
jgi:5'-nucleotidase/UDP-sugar diphosphatase